MTDAEFPDALPPQYRLHWYVLERVLGQGGFGITYLARDTNLDQPVAIKEYLPVEVAARRADTTVRPRGEDQAERYRWGLDRFIKEARTLARFDHPSIVRVSSVFEHNGTAYMVMRFEDGENFGALLDRRRTLPEEDLMRVLLPVLDGLALVHGANFIHRDIKPDNIHLRADGSPVLLDFGSARHALGKARTMTILVAPGYAPFEQYYSGGEDQGPWTDIYSLGATCYRAIAGVPPMDAIARSKGILGSTRELLVPAAAIGAGRYSERLLKAIDHALAFAEKDRPQSIASWREELPGSGGSPGASAAGAVAPALSPRPEAGAPAPGARKRLAFVAVAAVAGAATYWMIQGRGVESPGDGGGHREATVAPPAEAPKPQADPAQGARDRDAAAEQARQQAEREAAARAAAEERAAREALARKAAEERAEREAKERARQEQKVNALIEAQKREAEERRRAIEEAARKNSPARAWPPLAVPPGDREAFAYLGGQASQGHPEAAFKYAELHEVGRGTPPNPNLAYLWYRVAEYRGVAAAAAKRESVGLKLQPAEVRQMEDQARALSRRGG